MKIIANPSEPIEKIDEPWMPPGTCALVGDKDVAFLKNGEITVLSMKELSVMQAELYRQCQTVKYFDANISLVDFERKVSEMGEQMEALR